MTYRIRKAAVIGSGTMGAGIAALLAGVGVPTLMLDIPAKGTNPGDAPAKRNAVAVEGLKRLQASRPPQVFSAADMTLIDVGNIDDDLNRLSDVDWVIEVVVEKLDIKRNLMAKLAEAVGPNTIISTNTSGLPIKAISEGMDHDFKRRFLGTHFFNPPRYLQLLEVIPGEETEPAVVETIRQFASRTLGKGVVLCQDEPNFIGNRFMSITSSQVMNYAIDNGFTVDEVDALTGPLIGRPKTATFRLNDLVGTDVAVYVARNLYPAIPNDPDREVLKHPKVEALFDHLLNNNMLGNKSGQGFYKQVRGANGEKEFWSLNLNTLDYEAPTKPRFDSVGKHRKVEPTGERIRLLINEDDRAGQFLFHLHAFYLAYASHRVPEITESLLNVDNAQKWGFSHELGPFEIWDALGVEETIPRFEAAGYRVADWVKAMVADGHKTFYRRDEAGQVIAYYDPTTRGYVTVIEDPRHISVAGLRARKLTTAISPDATTPIMVRDALRDTVQGEIARNDSAALLDMGDNVLLLEFHHPNYVIDADLVQMGYTALEHLDQGWDALVVGHDGERFCIGANLLLVAMAVQSDQIDQLETMVSGLQNLAQGFRYAPKPVVIAPFNMALGGGTELMMGGTRVVAHGELYAGLVEFGVGVIPAGGGCKELVRRNINPLIEDSPNANVLPHLQRIFEMVSTAKVSGSAREARQMGFLTHCDRIVLNRAHLLYEAKREALHLADGYIPSQPGKVWAAGRDVYAAMLMGIKGFEWGGYASEHDALIARKLAYVLTGGAVSEPQWIDEQVMLDLEREAFVELAQHPKTLERIGHMLQTNKPLRN